MSEGLSTGELIRLIQRVFRLRESDRALALLVDLPGAERADHPAWTARRAMAYDWWRRLRASAGELGLGAVSLVLYRNAGRNNADLPERAWIHAVGELPASADRIEAHDELFEEILARHQILIAPTELSATAPLKLAARRHGFRAATMPGFSPAMIPALQLDYEEVARRCNELKALLDPAVSAHLRFQTPEGEQGLTLDLRHRSAIASGGLVHEPGTAGNLPSGETYIVPYEGERPGDPSQSRGLLPLELERELLLYRIEENRVVEVIGRGPVAARERAEMRAEPAYANVAELGLGVLADYGVQPVGALLLDEKLGLHIAFGRSDHFGGQVGAAAFSSPDRVVHIDRVYIPEVQPSVSVAEVQLELPAGRRLRLMERGRYLV